jgi:hypothetical protein
MTAIGENQLHDTVSRVSDSGDGAGLNHPSSGLEEALSSRWQDLIDQPIVRCVEWIDESNSCQFKAILQVLGDQMTNAGPLCRGP